MLVIPLWKRLFILGITLLGILFAVPSFLPKEMQKRLPSWLQEEVSLGLDLQGGSHLLLEIDTASALKDQLDFQMDEIRRTLRKEHIPFSGLKREADAVVFKINGETSPTTVTTLINNPTLNIRYEAEHHEFKVGFTAHAIQEREANILRQTREIIERRVNSLGTKEPNIQTQGDNRIIVQLPGVEDPSQIKKLLGQTAKLTFQLVDKDYPTLASTGGRILPGTEAFPEDPKSIKPDPNDHSKPSRSPITYLVKKRVYLTGENLINAAPTVDQRTNQNAVSFQLDATGARKFGEVTKNHPGEQLALVLDGKVVSAPTINEPILGGSGQITGNFTLQEAALLSITLRSGALPAPIQVIEERTVGPDLGADSIQAGELATVVSIVLIFVFMIVAYALFGVFANIALVCNLLLLVAALALTGSTLTLPGLAGIALTLGMAVDANVLIYERIKEELRAGTSPKRAIDAGYKRAMATILDSNITTLIGAIALYFFGSGPVKGFGVTLTMGICISMFTAITLARVITVIWLGKRSPKTLPI